MTSIILLNILRGILVLAKLYYFSLFLIAIIGFIAIFSPNIFNVSAVVIIYTFLRSLIDPALMFLSRYIPRMGMIDLSFLVLLIFNWIVIDICTYYIIQIQSYGMM